MLYPRLWQFLCLNGKSRRSPNNSRTLLKHHRKGCKLRKQEYNHQHYARPCDNVHYHRPKSERYLDSARKMRRTNQLTCTLCVHWYQLARTQIQNIASILKLVFRFYWNNLVPLLLQEPAEFNPFPAKVSPKSQDHTVVYKSLLHDEF